MAASSGVAVDATFSFASPFPAAKDRSFPLVHNTIPIRTADENRFMRISRRQQRRSDKTCATRSSLQKIERKSSHAALFQTDERLRRPSGEQTDRPRRHS